MADRRCGTCYFWERYSQPHQRWGICKHPLPDSILRRESADMAEFSGENCPCYTPNPKEIDRPPSAPDGTT